MTEKADLPLLSTRLALRPVEVAKFLGVSERTLHQMLPGLPHLRVGGVVLLPVDCHGLFHSRRVRRM